MLRTGVIIIALSLSVGVGHAQAPKKAAAKSCLDVCSSYGAGDNKKIQVCVQRCETARAVNAKKK